MFYIKSGAAVLHEPRWDAAVTRTVREHVCLRHVRSLWNALQERTLLGCDPPGIMRVCVCVCVCLFRYPDRLTRPIEAA